VLWENTRQPPLISRRRLDHADAGCGAAATLLLTIGVPADYRTVGKAESVDVAGRGCKIP